MCLCVFGSRVHEQKYPICMRDMATAAVLRYFVFFFLYHSLCVCVFLLAFIATRSRQCWPVANTKCRKKIEFILTT